MTEYGWKEPKIHRSKLLDEVRNEMILGILERKKSPCFGKTRKVTTTCPLIRKFPIYPRMSSRASSILRSEGFVMTRVRYNLGNQFWSSKEAITQTSLEIPGALDTNGH